MKRFFILIFLAFITGCATQGKYVQMLDTWPGHSEQELVEKWGVPTSTYELDNKKYLLYSKSRVTSLPGSNPSLVTTIGCDTTFIISDKKVESWTIKGNACKSN